MRELGAAEIDELLTNNGIGILAFDGGVGPYPIPVAFGYDSDEQQFVVQLEGAEDCYKKRCLDLNPNVGFTMYEQAESGTVWRSVVLRGRLEEISYTDAEAAFATLARNTQGAPNPVRWRSGGDEMTPYELQIDHWSGHEFVIE